MLSWNLWRSLQNPPLKHPIYRRANTTPLYHSIKRRKFPMYSILMLLVLALFGAKLLHVNMMVFVLFLPILFMLFVMVSPLLLPIVIFCYGVFLTTRISHTIFVEKQQATYDLLHLPPKQPIDVDWTLSAGILYQGQIFRGLNFAMRFVLTIAGIVLTILLLIFLATGNRLELQVFIEISALLALFYTGYIQTIVLSMIVGLLVPHFTANVQDNTFDAALAYLLIQCGSYLAALLLAVGLLPLFYNYLHIVGWWADMSLVLWRLVLIYGLRELLITVLWRHLAYRLNSDTSMLG